MILVLPLPTKTAVPIDSWILKLFSNHCFQIVAVSVFLAFAFSFYVFFIPFVGSTVLKIAIFAVYSPMVCNIFSAGFFHRTKPFNVSLKTHFFIRAGRCA